MLDPQKWKIALARFTGYHANVPSFIKTDDVDDYHAIVGALEEASGEDLSNFKIPSEKLKQRVVGIRPASYRGGRGNVQYSPDKYCDSTFFQGQIDALKHYLPSIQTTVRPKTQYDGLLDWQLDELMVNRRIKPPKPIDSSHPKHPDREYIIAALIKSDAAQAAQPSTVLNIYDSNVNYGSPGAAITQNVAGFTREEFSNLIGGLRELLNDVELDHAAKEEINVSIGTIELQLSASRPNRSILKESLKSLSNVLQNTATSLLTSTLLPTVQHLLNKL